KTTGLVASGSLYLTLLVLEKILNNPIPRSVGKGLKKKQQKTKQTKGKVKNPILHTPNLSGYLMYYVFALATIYGGVELAEKNMPDVFNTIKEWLADNKQETEENKLIDQYMALDRVYENPNDEARDYGKFADVRRGYSQGFGFYGATRGENRKHRGQDLAYAAGANVRAEAGGKLVEFTKNGPNAKTKWICIEHDDGTYGTYLYMATCNFKPGQKIKRGDIIGKCEDLKNLGYSEDVPNHCHFGLMYRPRMNDKEKYATWEHYGAINPSKYITANRPGLDKEFFYSPEYNYIIDYLWSKGRVVEIREINNKKTLDLGYASVQSATDAYNTFVGFDGFDTTTQYNMKNSDEFKKCFDAACPILFQGLTVVETSNDHDDTGRKGSKNTLGQGFYYWPEQGNETGQWKNVTATFPSENPSMENKYKNMMAWFELQNGGAGYAAMQKVFKCVMTPNELAGCMLAVFNAGANRQELFGKDGIFKKINDNIDHKEYCAYLLASVEYGQEKYRAGLTNRHCMGSLMFLNVNGIVNKMPFMREKSATLEENYKGHRKLFSGGKYNIQEAESMANRIMQIQGGKYVFESVMKSESYMEHVKVSGKSKEVDVKKIKKPVKENNQVQEEYQEYDALGLAAYQNKNYTEAMSYFEEAIKRDPDNAQLRNDLSITYFNLERYQEAIEQADEVLNRIGNRSQYSAAYYNKGKSQEALGLKKQAAESYILAAELGNNVAKNAADRLQDK
ncbi:peptidoglycan DD-metalloendopeptidase family protein, partial [Lachnospiraceae bacterium OttesenSCG-928-E19]|nr:peptidoglycan DD-metalloendopeptidase family protein [Lachnospiraceae bacterium OttesenSCG-928-E19]